MNPDNKRFIELVKQICFTNTIIPEIKTLLHLIGKGRVRLQTQITKSTSGHRGMEGEIGYGLYILYDIGTLNFELERDISEYSQVTAYVYLYGRFDDAGAVFCNGTKILGDFRPSEGRTGSYSGWSYGATSVTRDITSFISSNTIQFKYYNVEWGGYSFADFNSTVTLTLISK